MPTVVYATSGEIVDGQVSDAVRERLVRALDEAALLAAGRG